MNEEQMRIVDAMDMYGGGFVKGLAVCFRNADANNFQKLQAAFPEYWEEYDKMSAPVKTDGDQD